MTGKKKLVFLAVIIALATLVVYTPALKNDFVLWDDNHVVTDNINIRSLSLDFFRWAFSDVSGARYWHPVTWISHAIDYYLWGLNPAGHHLTSILLHAANTFIVVLLIAMLLQAGKREPRCETEMSSFRDETFNLTAAAVAGFLFGIHPIHAESVAWVSERKDLLYSLFFLLSVLAYLQYAKAHPNGISAKSRIFSGDRRYLLSIVLFILALASKPMAVTLPAVLIILDWYPLKRISSIKSFVNCILEKTGFIVLSLAITIATILVQNASSQLPSLEFVPLSTRVLVACKALILYLWKIFFPADLSPLYPYPKSVSFFSVKYLFPAFLVVATTVACIISAKKQKVWLAVWMYYIISLLPVLGLIQVGLHSMADRFTYLPGLGPFLLAGLGTAHVWGRAQSFSRSEHAVKGLSIAIASSLCIGLAWVTVHQIAVWKNTITLWSFVITKEPGVSLPYTNRGVAYARMGRSERAFDDFASALALDPVSPLTHNNRGRIYLEMGQTDLALADFDRAIQQDPEYQNAYLNRGAAFVAKGQPDRALEDYTKALLLKPDSAEAYLSRGILHGEAGRHEQAIEDFTRAISANPYHADSYTARGLSLEQSGRLERAIEDLDRAISLNPSSVDAYLNRGVVFERIGAQEKALADYTKALSLDPTDYLVFHNRGIVFAKLGRDGQAIEDQTDAISLNPGFIPAYHERARLYEKAGNRELALRDHRTACYQGSGQACEAMQRLNAD